MEPTPKFNTETTVILVRRTLDGDMDAREALFARCVPRLAQWAHGRMPANLRGPQDTVDVVQQVLLDVLTQPCGLRLRNDGHLLAYLRSAVLHRIKRMGEALEARAERRDIEDEDPGLLIARDPSPTQELVTAETLENYEAALARLTERERTAVILKFDLGLKVEEIAQAMRIKTWSAAQHLVIRSAAKVATIMRPSSTDAAMPRPGTRGARKGA